MLATSPLAGRPPFASYIAHGTEAGIQWTKIRETVLRLFWNTIEPLGAYQAAERLSEPGRVVHPASVYRCLRCLVGAGLIVQIVTWNKYLLSPDPAVGIWAALLCRDCRSCTLVDLGAERPELDRRLKAGGFRARIVSAECRGRCSRCGP